MINHNIKNNQNNNNNNNNNDNNNENRLLSDKSKFCSRGNKM